jgi:hypothetical protein
MFLINIKTIKHMNRLWKGNSRYTFHFVRPGTDGSTFYRSFVRDNLGHMSSSHGLDDNFQYYWDIEEQLRRYNYIKKKIKVFKKLGCTLEEITILMGELEILKKLGLR